MNFPTEKYTKFIKKTEQSQNIALFCHISPDGDTVASALALKFALEKQNKNVTIFCDDKISKKLEWLDGASCLTDENMSAKLFDTAIAIDCADFTRLGQKAKIFERIKTTIAIDHHKTFEKFADLCIVDPKASATGEIMFEILDKANLVDNTIAKLIFAAIVSDNGCFSFNSTTKFSHEIASKLYDYDFSPSDVIYNINKKRSIEIFNLKQRVLSKCKFYTENKIAIITFKEEDFVATNTVSSGTDGIISELIDIDSVEIAISMSQASEYSYKVSIRSKNVDASDCARQFGGGGHKNAAGCRINGHYEDIVEKLLKVANDRL